MKHALAILLLSASVVFGQTLTNTNLDGVTNATLNGVLDNDAAATRTALGLGTAATEDVRSLNAKAYGATGDGTTDDTTALQNLLNAAAIQMRSAFIPKGTYRITAALTIPNSGGDGGSGFSISGEGMNATFIVQETVNVHGISRTGFMNALRISDMTIRLPEKATTTGNCIDLDGEYVGLNQCVIRNLETQDGNIGIMLETWNNSLIESCRMGRSTYESNVGLQIEGNSNANTYNALSIMSSTTGIIFSSGGYHSFNGLDMGGGGQLYPIKWDASASALVSINAGNVEWHVASDSNTNAAIDLNGSSGLLSMTASAIRNSSGGAGSGYSIRTGNNSVNLANTQLQATYFGGLTTTFTAHAGTDVITTAIAHALDIGFPVKFTSTGTLPGGLAAGTTYYVLTRPTTTTMTLSSTVPSPSTAAGTLVNLTGGESGTHTIVGSTASIRNDNEGRVFYLGSPSSEYADLFSASVYTGRIGISPLPQATLPTASESWRGRMFTNQMSASNAFYDRLQYCIRNWNKTYEWVDLIDYHTTKATTGAGTNPAFLGAANTFTATTQTIQGTFPLLRLRTSATDGDGYRASFVIITSNDQAATGVLGNDTLLSAKSGGGLALATGTGTAKQTVRVRIKDTGVINTTSAAIPNYADDTAADAGLASGDLYTTTAGGRTVYRKP